MRNSSSPITFLSFLFDAPQYFLSKLTIDCEGNKLYRKKVLTHKDHINVIMRFWRENVI